MTNQEKSNIDALINLLEDDDKQVSTLAMEQLLTLDQGLDEIVADLQESQNPILRNRIHQLGNILSIRRSRGKFIDDVKRSMLNLWDGVVKINFQYNVKMNIFEVENMMSELKRELPARLSTTKMINFMRRHNFIFTGDDQLDAELYLIEDVLIQRIGAPILLAVIAHELGNHGGWYSNIVIYRGRHCLMDANDHIIEPSEEWKVTRKVRDPRPHICHKDDVWMAILSQLFLSAILEGRLQAIHRVGAILAKLSGGNIRFLPFPLGS